MLLDRQNGPKQKLSDQELQYYKQRPTKSAIIHLKRKAEEQVIATLILDRYLDFCRESKPFHSEMLRESATVKEWFSAYPFNSGLWDLPYGYIYKLTSPQSFRNFRKRTHGEKGRNLPLFKILGLKPENLRRTQRLVRKARRSKLEDSIPEELSKGVE